ncbi:unnamed protein product [Rhizoctonia solani]|uniref:tyrosinase n=1 Tax=Rhizoctonia solani TaxID=456999 RepID=A0A8H3DS61_9AGAM|nr:unnamed protein product [Rhizoctonia solani]
MSADIAEKPKVHSLTSSYATAPYLITGVVIPPPANDGIREGSVGSYDEWMSRTGEGGELPTEASGAREATSYPPPRPPPPPQPFPPPPPRLDIYDLRENEPKQFTLFVLSWGKIMAEDFHPRAASFQEIAILFPSWHRPHLMLLEQIMSDVAHGIASDFASRVKPDQGQEWMKAAQELRLPFWDWTHPRTGGMGIPEFLTTPEIELHMWNEQQETHPNSLAFYRLTHPVDGFSNRYQRNRAHSKPGTAYLREWTRTYRNPNSQAVNVVENYQEINSFLTSERGWKNLTNQVARIFAFPLDIPVNQRANAWDEFSNTTFQSAHRNIAKPNEKNSPYQWSAVSIEQPHNLIHVIVGGIGHMSDSDTASYDPIFYLHHCNVDRLLAFWEHIYPDYTAGTEGFLEPNGFTRTPFTQAGGTWIESENQALDIDSPLWPFRDSTYNYWNSRDTHSLLYHTDPNRPAAIAPYNKYYTYPPIVYEGHEIKIDTDPHALTPLKVRKKQRRYLQDYFHYDAVKAREDSGITLLPGIFSRDAPYSSHETPLPGRKRVQGYREFVVSVSLDPTFVKGSHTLVVLARIPRLLDGIPSQPGVGEAYEIGRVAVFSRGASETCGNCQAQRAARARVRGIVVVPHQVVTKIVQNLGLNKSSKGSEDGSYYNPEKDDESLEVVEDISLCLEAALVLPDGTLHSRLQADPPRDGGSILSGDALPHLELWSSDVYLETDKSPENEKDVPYDFDDWKKHTTLDKVKGRQRYWF